MPGVIDEFLLCVKMEGDPSGLVEAYKKIFDLQEEYKRREREQDEEDEESGDIAEKRGIKLQSIQQGVASAAGKGVSVLKQGVSVARGWAVALLAVDGAAMAVVGRLSQMAVEYQNVAEATGTSSEKMKAWEDTFKAAGGSADDVRSSLSQLYATARKQLLEGGEDAFAQAMATFDVKMTDESGNMRDTADIFEDLIFSARRMIEGGTDRSVVLQRMAGAGLSESLIAPLMAQRPEGGYRITQESFQKYLGRTQGMDELADASREISESATELSSVVRSKLTAVLTRMVESGMLTDLLDRITEFIDGIDPDAVAEVIDNLIKAIQKVTDWVGTWLPDVVDAGTTGINNIINAEERQDFAKQSLFREQALKDALKEEMGFMGFQGFAGPFGTAAKPESVGGRTVTETELASKAYELGLDPRQIFQKAGVSTVNNEVMVFIDGKFIPHKVQERQYTPAGSVGGSTEQ